VAAIQDAFKIARLLCRQFLLLLTPKTPVTGRLLQIKRSGSSLPGPLVSSAAAGEA